LGHGDDVTNMAINPLLGPVCTISSSFERLLLASEQ
jgi:hypothetical protein